MSLSLDQERSQPATSNLLVELFDRINLQYFDGFLDRPVLRWNSRLRASAGRFFPGSRKFWQTAPPVIEVASYLLQESRCHELVADTLAHEMVHYWLWIRRRPYGHTPEFSIKLKTLGANRYNTVPRLRRYRYVYRCGNCLREFPVRRRLGLLACASCCKQFADGKYDPRFNLVLDRTLSAHEAAQFPNKRV